MKGQWALIMSLVFALIVALFAVINVEPVTVDYLFGTADWPLILVILGSALLGGLAVGSIGIVRVYRLQRKAKSYESENNRLKEKIAGSKSGPLSSEETHEEDGKGESISASAPKS
nr:lipopolysaccharide assembly protein LapA domain-containing protein [Bacillus marinisedimentorum]